MKYKEFLNMKNGYTLEILPEHAGDDKESGLIEVPEGAEFLTECFDDGELFRLWWKEEYKICIGYDEYWFNVHLDVDDYLEEQSGSKIVWQRHTQPEELPFIDDEPTLNDQYAEIEKVRQDNVNHPSHYTLGGIECIDAIESSMTKEAFCGYLKGNVQKYMWRYENKGGAESLQKAKWYLKKLINAVE